MRKAVLDTNTIVSALLNPRGQPGLLLDLAFKGGFVLITTGRLIDELHRALDYPKVVKALARHRGGWSAEDTASFINAFQKFCRLSSGRALEIPVCRDPDDDWLLACAEESGAEVIVSGDKDLLTLQYYRGIRILDARAFLNEPRP